MIVNISNGSLCCFPTEMILKEHLRNHSLFNTIKNESLINFLANNSRLLQYSDGYHVYREGNKAVSIFILIKGTLQIVSGDGEYELETIRQGSGFAEISALAHERRFDFIDIA